MAFFNKLGDLARNIGEKTGDAIETGKLTAKIASERSAMSKQMEKVGAYVYEQYKAGNITVDELAETFAAIDGHQAAIDAAQAEIDGLKAAEAVAQTEQAPVGLTCPGCGKENAAGTKFCSGCGMKQEAPAPRLCPTCGVEVAAGAKFCPTCGAAME